MIKIETVGKPYMRYLAKVIPLAFDESMSYYEQICSFKAYLINEVMPALNNNAEAVAELQELYIELDNYVKNLDLQDEVDKKLEEMYENGQLESLIEQFIELQTTFTYNNVAEMKEATNLTNNMFVRTSGFNTYNDGGGAYYKIRNITSDDTIDEITIISLDNNLVIAELMKEKLMNVKQFGAKGDGVNDDTSNIQKAFDYCNNIIIENGTYMIDASVSVKPQSNSHISLVNATLKAIPNDLTNYKILWIGDVNNVIVEGGIIQGERQNHSGITGEWGHCININNASNIHIKDIILKDAWGDGIYINNGTNITTQNILCDNNRRQGVSIIKVDGYHSLNDKIINTNGTSPEYAIDIEPNSNTDYIKNVVIENLYSENNNGGGISVFLPQLDNTTDPVSIRILNHHDKGSTTGEKISVPYNLRHTIITENALLENNLTGISLRDCYDNNNDKIQIIKPKIINCNYDTSITATYVCGISGYTTESSINAIGGVKIVEPYITSAFATTRRSISFYDTTNTTVCNNIEILDPINHQSNLNIYCYSNNLLFTDKYEQYKNVGNYAFQIQVGDMASVYSNINYTSARTLTLYDSIPIGREITFVNEKQSYRISVQMDSNDYIRYFDASTPGKKLALDNVNSLLTIKKVTSHEWIVTNIVGSVTAS